jgi:hypothetical protein
VSNTFIDGKVHVRRTQCKTCIYRPENRGRIHGISDERREQMERDAARDESVIPCHSHLYEGEPIEPVCRGYWNAQADQVGLLRLAQAMDIVSYDDRGRV